MADQVSETGPLGQSVMNVHLMVQDESNKWVPLKAAEGGLVTSVANPTPPTAVLAATALTDNAVVRGDGGVRGVQTSGVIIDDSNNVTGMTTLTLPNTGLHLAGALSSVYDLIIQPSDGSLSADRTLSINTGNSDQVLTLGNNLTANGTARSVIGRSASTNGPMADIAAANDGEVMLRNGTDIGFSNFGVLTTVDPALDDEIPLSDTSASNANKNTAVDRLLGFGPHVFNARLTLESGVPISTSDQTAKTTVYLTPYNGNRVRVYDGTRWKIYALTEKSLAIGTLASAVIPNDIFLYDNSGTLTLEKLAWTNATTRATALTTQDGVYVKSGDTTRLYVGTFYPTATTTTEDSEAKRFLINVYNQVQRALKIDATVNSHADTSSTIKPYTNDSTVRVETISLGISSQNSVIDLLAQGCGKHNTTRDSAVGIGLDSTTADAGTTRAGIIGNATEIVTVMTARYNKPPGTGYHFFQMLQIPNASASTATFYGDNGGTVFNCGLTGNVWG